MFTEKTEITDGNSKKRNKKRNNKHHPAIAPTKHEGRKDLDVEKMMFHSVTTSRITSTMDNVTKDDFG